MKLQNKNLAFTLIELLVVITIIGILATWATSVYTSQIQKARDSTRVTSLKALQWAVEQSYQDTYQYPASDNFSNSWSTTDSWIADYIDKFPADPKEWQSCINTYCAYAYIAGPDTNHIEFAEYELSTAFENSSNHINRAWNSKDKWGDDDRLEVWINTKNNDTKLDLPSSYTKITDLWCKKMETTIWNPDANWLDAIFIWEACNQ